VNAERRRAISTPGDGSILVSVAIHAVAIALLVRMVIVPFGWADRLKHTSQPAETHVDYVRTSADTVHAPAKSGGDNRAITKAPMAAPLAAPAEVPTALPPQPPKNAAPPVPASGSGEIIGNGGPTKGVVPSFADPRVWEPTSPAPVRPKSQTERLDSAIAMRVHHLQDSLAALGPQRAPGDWTWGKDGKKYGIDQKYIHLGDFSIPTALLAFLPLNVQGNPATYETARRIGAIRDEIIYQDAKQSRDADFNAAVAQLRARKQKERADKAKEDQTIPEAPPPVKVIP
jgi:hypothetical protein